MTREELLEMDIKEVTAIAKDIGVPAKALKRAAKPDIVEAILKVLADNPAEVEDAEEAAEDDTAEEAAATQEPEKPVHTAEQTAAPVPLPHATKKDSTPKEIRSAVAHLVKRGLQIVQLDEEAHPDGHHQWHFRFRNKEAAGTVFQPLRTIVQQASILMQPTKVPTEE